MDKLNYSQNNIDASTKNQKSSFNRKRPFPQESPPSVQNLKNDMADTGKVQNSQTCRKNSNSLFLFDFF